MSEPVPRVMGGEYPDWGSRVTLAHYDHHDKSKTVAECGKRECREYAEAKAAGRLQTRKHRGLDTRPDQE